MDKKKIRNILPYVGAVLVAILLFSVINRIRLPSPATVPTVGVGFGDEQFGTAPEVAPSTDEGVTLPPAEPAAPPVESVSEEVPVLSETGEEWGDEPGTKLSIWDLVTDNVRPATGESGFSAGTKAEPPTCVCGKPYGCTGPRPPGSCLHSNGVNWYCYDDPCTPAGYCCTASGWMKK